ncbi:collagen-binding domain-containing protein, partial [Glutamicibacter soli]
MKLFTGEAVAKFLNFQADIFFRYLKNCTSSISYSIFQITPNQISTQWGSVRCEVYGLKDSYFDSCANSTSLLIRIVHIGAGEYLDDVIDVQKRFPWGERLRTSRVLPADSSWKKVVSSLGISALFAGTIIGAGTQAAVAESATINPFDINQGFTSVALGDVSLNNGEIEGSIAAFGSISTSNQNGYPVLHNAAGAPGYKVPTVDGVPVRILAAEFTGQGAFDVSNRDDSGTITADSPEANAVVKLSNIEGIQGSERGNFLRLTNSENGVIDLKSVAFAGSDVANYKTSAPSVRDYFSNVEGHVSQVNQCLGSMYDSTLGLSHAVDLNEQGGMLFPSGFASDRPNVFNYADIAGKTIKMDNSGGYVPSADAPLVIRVEKGTDRIGSINFEGWSAHSSAQQSLARYIMLDLSEVTGPVTIDGLELGAIWAPNGTLNFNSGITTNGQWFAGGNMSTAGGGEFHHHSFSAKIPCGSAPVEPTEPTTPTAPTEPTTPTEPTEPTTPTEPTEPTTPTAPTEPTTPTEPTEPTTPTEPTEPT